MQNNGSLQKERWLMLHKLDLPKACIDKNSIPCRIWRHSEAQLNTPRVSPKEQGRGNMVGDSKFRTIKGKTRTAMSSGGAIRSFLSSSGIVRKCKIDVLARSAR